ncbi:BTAD domain-containing putative transcriptional regulator [Streptosporangium sp. NPDC000095]|uniref:AfsR/SARP family transcriptional regulator n=1 Tax=Streptosporangium sp. NPDC000095 TaxID=3366184 RepID=UPI0036C89832
MAVLGPFEVRIGADQVELGSNRLRTLLAVLALSAGETVSVDRLASVVWAGGLPDNVRRSVHTYIARLRNTLGAEVIKTTSLGYQMQVAHDQVDALLFRRLLAEATPVRGTEAELAPLEQALALWRGQPFEGIDSPALHGADAAHLLELHVSAAERWIDLGLAAGRHSALVPEARKLAAHHRLHEPLWGRLLLTLDGCGRRAEALSAYERLRRRLSEELGTAPSAELQRIHADLLQDRAVWGVPITPRQLPVDVAEFTGRDEELKRLDGLLSGSSRVCVITGTAGVGKTCLAVHWAHLATERFPGGQLYVDLQGFGPGESALDPHEALSGFLQTLGVPKPQIPVDPQAMIALYRTLLAGRRALVLLDNARDVEQVRWLLPGGTECMVVITSRQGLSSLVSQHAAALLTLDVLTYRESRQLLTRRLGRECIEADARATDEIIDLCGRLPLPLAIAAGRATATPSVPLAALSADLRRVRTDVSVLATRDARTDMRTVFSRSYDLLPSDAARLFSLLAIHPGPDIARAAVASLAAVDRLQADRLLDVLLEAHLVAEAVPGRFMLHNLLRTYAHDLAGVQIRQQAARRVIEHYLHTACRAARLLAPEALLIVPNPPAPGVRPERLVHRRQALDWFRAEHAVLSTVLRQALTNDFPSHVIQLAAALTPWCDHQSDWHTKADIQRLALKAAEQLGDIAAMIRVRQTIAAVTINLERANQAPASGSTVISLDRIEVPGG